MEILAYAIAFQLYLALRRKFKDVIAPTERWQVIAAAAFGAVFGSRILAWLEDPVLAWHSGLTGGKTIVGALIGGWIAVEAVKAKIGIRVRTGDLLAIPLAAGIAIGRIGCFLTGLSDQTYGNATTLPWGVDFGDGVRRHPTQLYEIVFLLLLCPFLYRGLKAVARSSWQTGDVFRVFTIAYSLWRICIDFLKPEPKILGMSALQWASLGVVAYCWRDLRRIVLRQASGAPLLMKPD
jgi:prolipoprotein diacylglyceryltransferase